MQLQPLVALIAGLLITLLLCYALEGLRTERCTVIITGESVKFLGCDFTKDFIDFAKQAKPFGSL
uniref:Movement protein TGBp3 n=1 Tax=Garlic latent virus TaxID=12458 RepID=A0A6M2YUB5_9VIRU|nr:TGB3 [Garlic latent virus]WAK97811.1 TGB3 [Garlic latent virus]WAK97829.1 TGB3 [Garlic latent virus]